MSAGLPHLVLLLAPEAQARCPLLEALAVVGPRLVGLELHHRGGLLPLLLWTPLRWPGGRHPAGEWGRGRVGRKGVGKRGGGAGRSRSVPQPAAARTRGRARARVTGDRVSGRKRRLCPGVRRTPWIPPPARLGSLLSSPPPPPLEVRG